MYLISYTHTQLLCCMGRFRLYYFFFSHRRLVDIISDTNTRIPFPLYCCCVCVLRREYNTQSPQTIECGTDTEWMAFLLLLLLSHFWCSSAFIILLSFLPHVCVCGWERVTQFPHGKASPRDPTVDIFISSSLRNDNNQTEKQPPSFYFIRRRKTLRDQNRAIFVFFLFISLLSPLFPHTHKRREPSSFFKRGDPK
jgi:hypothetical protein